MDCFRNNPTPRMWDSKELGNLLYHISGIYILLMFYLLGSTILFGSFHRTLKSQHTGRHSDVVCVYIICGSADINSKLSKLGKELNMLLCAFIFPWFLTLDLDPSSDLQMPTYQQQLDLKSSGQDSEYTLWKNWMRRGSRGENTRTGRFSPEKFSPS